MPTTKKPARKKKTAKRKTSKPKTVRRPARPKRAGNRKSDQSKWIKNAHDERAVAAGCTFDEGAADRVVRFFRTLRHSKGEWGGKRFELLDWQRDHVVYPVFGWKQTDGYRRIRQCVIWVAKKNGKSTLGAGLGLYLFCGDGEAGSHVYSAATQREQAAEVHDEAINMVRAANYFGGRVKVNESSYVISHRETASKYKTLSSKSAGSEGKNAHGLIIDELHAWTDRAFWDSLRYAGAGRRQPLRFILSTAGIYDPESIGHQQYTYAKQWLAGKTTRENQRFHAFIAEADPKDKERIDDPKVHRKANPSYGVTITSEEMAAEAAIVKDLPSERNTFLRYRLNIWVEAANPWLTHEKWDACAADYTEADLAGRACYGGLDLGSTTDITAFVLLFPSKGDSGKARILCRFFLPRDNILDLAKKTGVDYLEWERRGWLTLTPGAETDYEMIRQQILKDGRAFDIREIGADDWNLTYLAQRVDPGGKRIVAYSQNMKNMSPSFKALERMIVGGRIEHDGNGCMRWMFGNVVTLDDKNENSRPVKAASSAKIDGIVSLTMAQGCSMMGQNARLDMYDNAEPLRF